MRLTWAERVHLIALAQRRAPPFPSHSLEADDATSLQVILDGIVHPAYARNSLFDVLAWNASNREYFGDFAAIPPEERNVVRLMFTRSYHRKSMPSWDADVGNLLATFRFNFGQASDQSPFLSLIAELQAISPEFERLWANHNVSDRGEGVTRLISQRLGALKFAHQVLVPTAQPKIQIVMFIPIPPNNAVQNFWVPVVLTYSIYPLSGGVKSRLNDRHGRKAAWQALAEAGRKQSVRFGWIDGQNQTSNIVPVSSSLRPEAAANLYVTGAGVAEFWVQCPRYAAQQAVIPRIR